MNLFSIKSACDQLNAVCWIVSKDSSCILDVDFPIRLSLSEANSEQSQAPSSWRSIPKKTKIVCVVVQSEYLAFNFVYLFLFAKICKTNPQLTQPQLGITRNLKIALPAVRERRGSNCDHRVIRLFYSASALQWMVDAIVVVAQERRAGWMAEVPGCWRIIGTMFLIC